MRPPGTRPGSRLAVLICVLLVAGFVAVAPAPGADKEKKPDTKKTEKKPKDKSLGSSEAHVKYPEFENVLLLTIKVDAGDVDRLDTPVSVELPSNVNPFRAVRLVEVVGGEKKPVPMQAEAGTPNKLWLTLAGKTAKGTTRTFELWPGDPMVVDAVKLELGAQTLDVTYGGGKLFSYHHVHVVPPTEIPHEFIRSGYINPMFAPGGALLTEDFPKDHYHHKGIWFPWTNIEYEGHRVDDWNLGDRSGQVQFTGFSGVATGGVYGEFRADHQMMDVSQERPAGKVMINEQWDVKVYAQGGPKAPSGGYWLFDLTSKQRAAHDSPIKFPEYRYGGVAYRGPKNWVDDNYILLTSEGMTKENGHTTRAKWCAHSGATDGKWNTVVVMGHPANFRFPEPQRIWEKNGCFFNFAPSQAGDWTIEPGKDYTWRYRFFVYEGQIDKDKIERAWQDFGNPPKATVEVTR